MTVAGSDNPQKATAQFGLRTGWILVRLLRETQREDWEAIPPEYRPPAGKWLSEDHPRAVRLKGTDGRQDVLSAVVEVFREEDDDDQVAAWSWLDVRVAVARAC